ncbi:MAG: hypothetical protein ACKV2T_24320 [Kofleriaceae bacterium]
MKAWMMIVALSACTQDPTLGTDGGDGSGGGGGGGGGGGEVDPLDIAKSGSRIKKKVLSSSDGAKSLHGWFDSQRDEDCTWQVASDGMTRCTPTAVAWGGYFADASCTTPAGYYWANCTPPAYISVTNTTACPANTTTGPTLYMRGAPISTVYSKSGTSCVALTAFGYPAWAAGAVVPATTFQAATIAVE